MNYIVETKNLKKYYQMGDTTVKALDGIDFCVKDQEFIAIIGKSGSGFRVDGFGDFFGSRAAVGDVVFDAEIGVGTAGPQR